MYHLFVTYSCSFAATMLVEAPFLQLEKVMFRKQISAVKKEMELNESANSDALDNSSKDAHVENGTNKRLNSNSLEKQVNRNGLTYHVNGSGQAYHVNGGGQAYHVSGNGLARARNSYDIHQGHARRKSSSECEFSSRL